MTACLSFQLSPQQLCISNSHWTHPGISSLVSNNFHSRHKYATISITDMLDKHRKNLCTLNELNSHFVPQNKNFFCAIVMQQQNIILQYDMSRRYSIMLQIQSERMTQHFSFCSSSMQQIIGIYTEYYAMQLNSLQYHLLQQNESKMNPFIFTAAPAWQS